MSWKLLLFAVVLAAACCPKRQTVRVVTTARGCLTDVGPAPEEPDHLGTDDHTTDPACDEKWELCASAEAADRLVRYVQHAKRWIRDAKTQCSKEDTHDTNRSQPDGRRDHIDVLRRARASTAW